jgi:N-acetylglucosaminyldiphosphoundecaprenol N-acetyl-beta-D-mannosaminyltransferase
VISGTTAPARVRSVDLMGIRIDAIREDECVGLVMSRWEAGRGGWIVTPNLDHLRRLTGEVGYRELVADADLCVADGMPLVWAARLQGTPLPERVAGSNLIWSLSAAAAQRGAPIFLLGGDPGSAERATAVLRGRFPALRVAGVHCPPRGFEQDDAERGRIVRALLDARPAVVFVGLGSPKQERLIREMRAHLPSTWWIGVGISFSFVAGTVKRAPRWMQRAGLEWLHRLACEPRRLARRYLVDGWPFALVLFSSSVRRRIAAPAEVRT